MLSRIWRDTTLIWRAVLLFVVGTSILGSIALGLNIARMGMFFSDFTVLWTAARTDMASVYDGELLTRAQRWIIPASAGLRPFAYPPTFLPWLTPLAWSSYGAGLVAWSLAGVAIFAMASMRMFKAHVVAISMLGPMAFVVLATGQTTFLVGGLLVLGLSFTKSRPVAAGILLGLAATIKPQLALMAPIALAAAGNWRSLVVAAASGSLIGLACLALQGPTVWLAWLNALPAFAEEIGSERFRAMSVTPAAIAAGIGLGGWAARALILTGAVLGIALTWRVFRITERPDLRVCAWVTGGLLCSPYALNYEVAIAAPAAAALLLDRNGSRVGWFVGAVLFVPFAGALTTVMAALGLLWVSRNGARSDEGDVLATADSEGRVATGRTP